MEDVNTIVPIQLAATIAHVLLVIILMTMITVAQVRCNASMIKKLLSDLLKILQL